MWLCLYDNFEMSFVGITAKRFVIVSGWQMCDMSLRNYDDRALCISVSKTAEEYIIVSLWKLFEM
jgi:hypothetical protein